MLGTFSPDTQDAPICFDLTIVDDNIVEASEIVFVSLLSNDSAVLVPSEVNVTIQDNDGMTPFKILLADCVFAFPALIVVSVQLVNTSIEVVEEEDFAEVCVKLLGQIERSVFFVVMSLDFLQIPDYATAGT